MPRVLIITYYWPPSGGSSVLRWLKFTKYLREFGWEPVIYTPSNPESQEIDQSLLKDIPENLEVIRSRIWEPYSIYKWLTGKKQGDRLGVALMSDKKKPGIAGRISLWIRSNLFIPDPRRCWVRPSVNLLSGYLKANPADVIITTGPPHSMHLIGLGLKQKLGIRWVADFRDPWTDIDFYRDLLLTKFADWYHKNLERKVLLEADRIITVSPGMTMAFKETGIDHVETISNGYDEVPPSDQKHDETSFTLLHLGSLPVTRNPENLWQVLSELVKSNVEFGSHLKVRLIGKADLKVTESIRKFGLQQYVTLEEYVPHKQTLSLLAKASLLLLCINNSPNAKGILTNKFFEYLSARRPILALGPLDGDAAAILRETQAGRIFTYTDTIGLKEHVLALFDLYSHQNLYVESENYSRFSRKNLTQALAELLNNIIH